MSYFIIIISLFSFGVQADANVRRDIGHLAWQIEREVRDSGATLNQLEQVRSLMQESLDILQAGGGHPDLVEQCIEISFNQYRRQLPTSVALTRAQQRCQAVQDINVLTFLLTQHRRQLAAIEATDLSIEQASLAGIRGKLELVEYAFEKYNRQMPTTDAATRAAFATLRVPLESGLRCFERDYPRYSRSLPSVEAMDRTAHGCGR